MLANTCQWDMEYRALLERKLRRLELKYIYAKDKQIKIQFQSQITMLRKQLKGVS